MIQIIYESMFRQVKNWEPEVMTNLYIVLEDEYKEKLEWIERDL